MASFNKVQLLGNLVRDPQTKNVGSSTVTEFGVACNRKWKTEGGEEREEVTFVDCAAWGKTGELIAKYFSKGKPIFIEGRLKYDTWEKDGQKRSKLSVVVEQVIFLPRGDSGNEERPAARPQGKAPAKSSYGASARKPAEQPFGDEEEFLPDSIPF